METDLQMLKAILKYHDMTQAKIAQNLGITRDTFARRLRRDSFRIHEVRKMMEVIPLTMQEVEEIFFTKKQDAGTSCFKGKA